MQIFTGLVGHWFNMVPEVVIESFLKENHVRAEQLRTECWRCSRCNLTYPLDEINQMIPNNDRCKKYCLNCGNDLEKSYRSDTTEDLIKRLGTSFLIRWWLSRNQSSLEAIFIPPVTNGRCLFQIGLHWSNMEDPETDGEVTPGLFRFYIGDVLSKLMKIDKDDIKIVDCTKKIYIIN